MSRQKKDRRGRAGGANGGGVKEWRKGQHFKHAMYVCIIFPYPMPDRAVNMRSLVSSVFLDL